MQIIYKVVKPHGPAWRSFVITPEQGFCHLYEIGKATRPLVGKLFAFKERWKAERFLKDYTEPGEIFQAETSGICEPPASGVVMLSHRPIDDMRKFWAGVLPGNSTILDGTVLCSDITLLKRL